MHSTEKPQGFFCILYARKMLPQKLNNKACLLRKLAKTPFLVGAFSFKGKKPDSYSDLFFSRRFSSEKSPTITVASFFSVILQSHSDWSNFLTIETTKTTKAKSGQRKLVQKGHPFHFLLF